MRTQTELTLPMLPTDNSVGKEPQMELLQAVIDNNPAQLRRWLANPSTDVNHLYTPPHSGTCLHHAVRHQLEDAVTLLLENNASPNVADSAKSFPLHYAAKQGLASICHALIQSGADVNARDAEERTPLHLLALQWNDDPARYAATLDVLLAVDNIGFDDRDCSQCSPLLLAAKRGAGELCRRLVEKGADLDCKAGRHVARDLIQKQFPWLLEVTPTIETPTEREPGQVLYESLTSADQTGFPAALSRVLALDETARAEALDRAHGNYTCLQFAADNGLVECVNQLLDAGAHVAIVSHQNRYSALHYACYHGYHSVLEPLLQAALKKGGVDLTQRDAGGLTLLHKVAKGTTREASDDVRVDFGRCLSLLLQCGLPVAVNAQDPRGNTALHYAALRQDQSLVPPLLLAGASVGVKNVFGTLAMSRLQPKALETALDGCVRDNGAAPADTEYTVKLQYHCLIPPDNTGLPFSAETEPLFWMGQSRRHRRLLRHPVLASFLLLKWLKIQPLYIANVLAYAAFVAILTGWVYLAFDVDPESGAVGPAPLAPPAALSAMEAVLNLSLVLLAVREVCQLSLSWRAYLGHRENYLQVALVVVLGVVLWAGLTPLTRLHVSVWAIILAWLELVLLLGRHPKLSTYIMMFKTVSENFIKFIFLYSFLIIAFSIAFHLLFRTDTHFNTYWRSLLKTVVMSTGEMEYTSLEFSRAAYSGHIAFFGFLFLIALVLMNLLNGLAVSDTAAIQADAELHSLVARAALIYYIESVFLGSGGGFCGGGGLCGRRCSIGGDSQGKPSCGSPLKLWLAHRTLLFPRCLKNKQLSVCPNKDKTRFTGCACHDFRVDEKIVESAQALLTRGERVDADRMEMLERKLDRVTQLLLQMTQNGGAELTGAANDSGIEGK